MGPVRVCHGVTARGLGEKLRQKHEGQKDEYMGRAEARQSQDLKCHFSRTDPPPQPYLSTAKRTKLWVDPFVGAWEKDRQRHSGLSRETLCFLLLCEYIAHMETLLRPR